MVASRASSRLDYKQLSFTIYIRIKKMSQKVIQKENSQKPVFLSQGQIKPQSQADPSQTSRVASQGQVLTQDKTVLLENVSSQDSVSTQVKGTSSQPVVPTLSQQSSQKSVSNQSQGCVPSQNKSQLDEKENIQAEIEFAKADGTPQNSQGLKSSSWLLRSGQSDSQGRDYLKSCTELLLNNQTSNNSKTDE